MFQVITHQSLIVTTWDTAYAVRRSLNRQGFSVIEGADLMELLTQRSAEKAPTVIATSLLPMRMPPHGSGFGLAGSDARGQGAGIDRRHHVDGDAELTGTRCSGYYRPCRPRKDATRDGVTSDCPAIPTRDQAGRV